MKKDIVDNLSVALNYIENAYSLLKYHIDNEKKLNELQRHMFYDYGIDKAKTNLIRLVNAKKGLLAVTGKLRIENKKRIDNGLPM